MRTRKKDIGVKAKVKKEKGFAMLDLQRAICDLAPMRLRFHFASLENKGETVFSRAEGPTYFSPTATPRVIIIHGTGAL